MEMLTVSVSGSPGSQPKLQLQVFLQKTSGVLQKLCRSIHSLKSSLLPFFKILFLKILCQIYEQ